jgi:hypothetical protein
VHDLVDSVIVGSGTEETEHSVIITMWFAKESLDEALRHFLYAAFPAKEYEEECRADLVVVIDNRQWEEQINSAFPI